MKKIPLTAWAALGIFAAIGAFFVSQFVYDGLWGHRDLQAKHNIQVCKDIKPGINLERLIANFGQPTFHRNEHGGSWYYFKTPQLMAGPIRAEVDEVTKLVVTLRCYDDGPPPWQIQSGLPGTPHIIQSR